MEVVVTVMHEGKAKMTGKIFGTHGLLIFWHEEVRPSQQHYKLDSPGGVDLCVLDYLVANGVEEIHHHRVDRRDTLIADLETFMEFAVPQVSGGRSRLFLPFGYWDRNLAVDYKVPWIEAKIALDPGPTRLPRTKVQRGTGIVYQHPLPGF